MTAKEKRWRFLDSLLAKGVPMSPNEIFMEYAHHPDKDINISVKVDPSKMSQEQLSKKLEQFLPSFRKDITLFKKALKKNGKPEMLKVIRGASKRKESDEPDNRFKQFCYSQKGFSIMPWLDEGLSAYEYKLVQGAINRLKGHISDKDFLEVQFAALSRIESDYSLGLNCVDFEDNSKLKGREYRPLIFEAIRKHQILEITYEPFGKEPFTFDFHPYLLKQYNERWYLFCYFPQGDIQYFCMALDRIVCPPVVKGTFPEEIPAGYRDRFKDIIGVYRNENDRPKTIMIGVKEINAWGRVVTKPLNTLTVVEEFDKEKNYGRVALNVVPNTEMYLKILGLGEHVEIETEPERTEMLRLIDSIASQYK